MNVAKVYLVLTAVLSLAFAQSSTVTAADEPGIIELVVPHALLAKETLQLRILVGPLLPRNSYIVIKTNAGMLVGTLAPFGLRASQSGGNYILPLPKNAVTDGRVRLLVEVVQRDSLHRPPMTGEIEGVEIISAD